MAKKKLSIVILSIIVLFLISVIFLAIQEPKTHTISRLFNDLILDNKEHYLPCDKLPDKQVVENVLKEQELKVKEIESIPSSTGSIMVSVGDGGNNCTNNADIIITYGSHSQRVEIEKIIGDETFFGIPYRLNNI